MRALLMPNALRSDPRRRTPNNRRVTGEPQRIAARFGPFAETRGGLNLPEFARPRATLGCDDQLYRQSLRNLIAVKLAR